MWNPARAVGIDRRFLLKKAMVWWHFITSKFRWRQMVGVAAGCVALLTFFISVDRWSRRSAAEMAFSAARERMRANVGLFDSELQKYRLIPLILAESSDVRSLLQPNPDIEAQLNVRLRLIAQHTGADVIYVIDRQGNTLASSNFDQATSFVGENFSFRPYFRKALSGRNAEYFAQGKLSGRPGLFFARPVSKGRGVVVVKIELNKLEADWASQPGTTIIRDRYGVVTAASDVRWVLRPTRPISRSARSEIQKTLQFETELPAALPFVLPLPSYNIDGGENDIVTLSPNQLFAVASQHVAFANWTLSSLEPLDAALRTARSRAQVIGLVATLIMVMSFGLLARGSERRRILVGTRRMLEEEVGRRTAELRNANDQLLLEVAERERTSRRLRTARDELAQANRLGSLGQITAGVAHEINQPVAAIQTFAENAKVLVHQADIAEANRNLDLIIELTSRIGRIIGELRAFARRDPPPIGKLRLSDALDGALLLVGDRLRADQVDLTMPPPSLASTVVLADRVRLEQVLINLLQNSLDALTNIDRKQILISIDVSFGGTGIAVTVDDSGAGVPPSLRATLFEPFVTGKKNGLGLGLGIAQDIIRQFGGELMLVESKLGGTALLLTLLKP